MKLHLIRHPRPAIAAGICYGASDVALADDPHAVAARLRPLLPAGLGESVPLFTSPLARCVALARALHESAASDARLAEIDFGDWEMRPWDDIGVGALDAWAADPIGFTPPRGESPRMALARALDFIDQLGAHGLPAACLVTHGGIMRLLAGHWLRRPESEWIDLRFGFGRVAAFDLAAPGGPQALFLDA